MSTSLVIGVDVGGTFTDVFFLDESAGRCRVAKVPSTSDDQAQGFIAGIGAGGTDFSTIATIIHGTTVATNTLLERNGAKTGVITTRGFRDVLEMRRRDRPRTWGLWGQFEPIVPRDLRLEVDERTLADGSIRTPLDPRQLKQAADRLLELGCEAVAVIFINAYANPANEQQALALLRAIWPNDSISASSDIVPEIREFERFSTAALNAYLQPRVGAYLGSLEDSLRRRGCHGDILIVQSTGGVMALDTARRLPIRTALSGPAAGVMAAAYIGQAAGCSDLITCDMGGTSFDVALIANGTSTFMAQTAIDFGLVIRSPMIEITTIGAGGGSIAWIDRGGLLQVGPQSAGSDPGPACYGLGNEQPTVTDANLVLGRINAERPIGTGLNKLDIDAASVAIARHVAKPLELDIMTAAEAIIRVANARMAGAIRLVSIERGHDPQRFVAMPFGGGGALHSGALIREVGLARALVPRFPGVTSALGCVIADMRHDYVHTLNRMLAELDVDALIEQMSRLADDGEKLLRRSGVRLAALEHRFELDMLYLGQTHSVTVVLPLDRQALPSLSREMIQTAFETTYREQFGRLLQGIAVRMMNLRVAVIGKRPRFDLQLLAPAAGGSVEAARLGERDVWIDGDWVAATVYERLALPVGAVITGPALLEQPDTTIWIEPELQGEVDRFGNLLIECQAG
jgi:N-methylhydantoinase A